MMEDELPATKDDIRLMLAEFTQVFVTKLNTTKAEVLEQQSKAASVLSQKLKDSTGTRWRREKNKRQ